VDFKKRYRALTERERDVMALVVLGRPNKQIGGELGLAEVTVKAHRRQIMQKMGAKSVPELMRIADQLGVAPEAD
jgi:FixJ family two-component response regulator